MPPLVAGAVAADANDRWIEGRLDDSSTRSLVPDAAAADAGAGEVVLEDLPVAPAVLGVAERAVLRHADAVPPAVAGQREQSSRPEAAPGPSSEAPGRGDHGAIRRIMVVHHRQQRTRRNSSNECPPHVYSISAPHLQRGQGRR